MTKKMTSSLCYYGILLLYDVYIFHVTVGLYSKRSKKTSIYGRIDAKMTSSLQT